MRVTGIPCHRQAGNPAFRKDCRNHTDGFRDSHRRICHGARLSRQCAQHRRFSSQGCLASKSAGGRRVHPLMRSHAQRADLQSATRPGLTGTWNIANPKGRVSTSCSTRRANMRRRWRRCERSCVLPPSQLLCRMRSEWRQPLVSKLPCTTLTGGWPAWQRAWRRSWRNIREPRQVQRFSGSHLQLTSCR